MVKLNCKLIFFVFFGSISLLTALSIWALSPFLANNQIPKPVIELIVQSQVKRQAEIDKNIPKNLYPCLPKHEQRLQLRESTNYNKKQYYVIGIYELPSTHEGVEVQPSYKETLVALDNADCQVIVSKDKMGKASLILYIPQTAARNLRLQAFRKAIAELGGKEKLEQSLLEEEQTSIPGDYPIYFPEDVWALKKLGIKLPKNIRIVNRADET